MSLCKEAACQEAIANLLIYLSSAKSFWYTLNTSHEHGFHLANRFGMSHDNYMALLVAADLARYTNGMLYIKRTQWELFLRGYYFSDVVFEMEKKKMMLGSSNKRQAFYVIRIGYIGMDSPRKFDDQGLDASPPRLASLGMTQLQFHRSTEDIVLYTKKHSDSKISKVKRAKLVRETTRLETLSQFGKESVWTLSQLLLQVEQKTLDEAKNNGKP